MQLLDVVNRGCMLFSLSPSVVLQELSPLSSTPMGACCIALTASSSLVLSSPFDNAVMTSSAGDTDLCAPIPLPMPIPKLGIRGATLRRLPLDMNLMLPKCRSSVSGRDSTSASISLRRSRIVRVVGRTAGSLAVQSRQRARNAGGHPGFASRRTSSGSIPNVGPVLAKCSSSATFLAAISQNMIPIENISVGRSNSFPSKISGDMYESVPQNVSRLLSSALRAAIRAKPKSVILRRPLVVTRRFSPLRSRWMHLRAWRYASERAISVAKDMRRRHGKGFVLSIMYVRRFPFSMYSDMMKTRPSGGGARESPRYRTTLGWRDSFMSLHSLSKYLATL